MRHDTPDSALRRHWLLALLAASVAALLNACKTTAPEVALPESPKEPDKPDKPVAIPVADPKGSARTSSANSPRAYREDGASHIYGLNADRVYKGKMPPLLYAIGVLNVEIDRAGRVTRLDWMRAPRHAPEVIAEIERTVKEASPFPAPTRLGKVVYTDTWLWHKSGKFQLDTLTEGQN
jgi:periplasmic protein TonB